MTNKEAYLMDLNDLRKEIDLLLSMVPTGARKTTAAARAKAEESASRAYATLGCMERDYIPQEIQVDQKREGGAITHER